MKSFNSLEENIDIYTNTLLEASAGTGKTFSIENIFVRLLLENNPSLNVPLKINEVLVVTFTRAATADLKHRIKKNIERCLHILKEFLKNPSAGYNGPYKFLNNFMDQGLDFVKCAFNRLEDALYCFDQSQILTIHSFCSKMLRENVFEGDLRVDIKAEEQMSMSEMQQIVRNFFRTELVYENYSISQLEIALKDNKGRYENLENAILKLIKQGIPIKKSRSFNELFLCFQEQMHYLKKEHHFSSERLFSDYENQRNDFKKLKQQEDLAVKIEEFVKLFEKDVWTRQDFEKLIQEEFLLHEFLNPKNAKAKNKKFIEPSLYYPKLWEILNITLHPLISEARNPEMITLNMAGECQHYYDNYCNQEEKLSFDSFLLNMNTALGNLYFKQLVQKKYYVAIIDEFQDTDPIQWKIFHTLFLEDSQEGRYLYLVGDPKQSIYSFRQADIYTYLDAAKALESGCIASLDTNFRSVKPLIDSLNALFSKETCGDFIILPRGKKIVPYRNVKAGSCETFSNLDEDPCCLHFFIVNQKAKRKNSYPLEEFEKQFFFPYIAKEIHNLVLNGLKYNQIAILVSDRYQAMRVDTFFKNLNIPCLLQRTSSLAKSQASQGLKEILKAFLNPSDENLLKIGLGSRILQYSHEEITRLSNLEAYESILAQVFELRKLLVYQGFSDFYKELMRSCWPQKKGSVKENILQSTSGIEFYEDLQQIAELLMEYQSENHPSADGLLYFLSEFDTLEIDEDPRIRRRIDNQKNAIIVTTMHSSKGLEYDVVFALGVVKRSPKPDLIIPAIERSERVLKAVLNCEDPDYMIHCEELDAEKMRQFYVAATRAKRRLYIPVVSIENSEPKLGCASPMDLFLEKMKKTALSNNSIEVLQNFVEKNSHISIKVLESENNISLNIEEKPSFKLSFPEKVTVPGQDLFIQSFTYLTRYKISPINSRGINFQETNPPNDFLELNRNAYTLPTGSETGNLLHLILETLAFDSKDILSHVQKYTTNTPYADWSECIAQIIKNSINIPLDGFTLSQISKTQEYRELDFLYPVDSEMPMIEGVEMNSGYLKGIIDLVFCYNGKYYIVDWKSNWMGYSADDYSLTGMYRCMIEHRYDLQASLYKEALRRYLKNIVDISFEEVYGGTYYLFLRGIDSETSKLNGIFNFEKYKGLNI